MFLFFPDDLMPSVIRYLIAFVLLWRLNGEISFTLSSIDGGRIARYLRSGIFFHLHILSSNHFICIIDVLVMSMLLEMNWLSICTLGLFNGSATSLLYGSVILYQYPKTKIGNFLSVISIYRKTSFP